ncbi:hypothetical protein QWY14_06400 [Planococcus sp. N028]|uniref:Uncharacterized protein n=1 Tax=Planococcus shixiaomingii TaxID=3058393 RepID=A0ABT8N1J0_9BACL|nr:MULTISPECIES: hypothetical protein [unclassified Planococcus (in: firmicutes)]MDN7241415.1 hypothetical protein [Planococcus sp. N028]WKA53669.1 hypothetical protein QWY21_13475 [Planococcus sp. N022]
MGEGSSTNLFATKQRSDAGATVFRRDSEVPKSTRDARTELVRREPAESVRLERGAGIIAIKHG